MNLLESAGNLAQKDAPSCRVIKDIAHILTMSLDCDVLLRLQQAKLHTCLVFFGDAITDKPLQK